MTVVTRFFKIIAPTLACCLLMPVAFANASSLWLQVINFGGEKDIPGHNLHYAASIPDNETLVNSSTLEGNLTPLEKNVTGVRKNSAILDIYRYDGNDIAASLKITDAAMDDRVIWEGKITSNPITNETVAAVSQVDDKHYNIHIEQNKPDQPSHLLIMQITNKE